MLRRLLFGTVALIGVMTIGNESADAGWRSRARRYGFGPGYGYYGGYYSPPIYGPRAYYGYGGGYGYPGGYYYSSPGYYYGSTGYYAPGCYGSGCYGYGPGFGVVTPNLGIYVR